MKNTVCSQRWVVAWPEKRSTRAEGVLGWYSGSYLSEASYLRHRITCATNHKGLLTGFTLFDFVWYKPESLITRAGYRCTFSEFVNGLVISRLGVLIVVLPALTQNCWMMRVEVAAYDTRFPFSVHRGKKGCETDSKL